MCHRIKIWQNWPNGIGDSAISRFLDACHLQSWIFNFF